MDLSSLDVVYNEVNQRHWSKVREVNFNKVASVQRIEYMLFSFVFKYISIFRELAHIMGVVTGEIVATRGQC